MGKEMRESLARGWTRQEAGITHFPAHKIFTSHYISLQVTQYSCDYENLAPKGCTQYFYGDNQQEIQVK